MTHDEAQQEILAYVASRLDGETSARIEAHLRVCDQCSENVGDLKELVGIISSHPDHGELRAFALGESPADVGGRIERHVVVCGACRLQVDAWSKDRVAPAPRRPRLLSLGRAPFFVAVGLMTGLGLSLWMPSKEARWSGPIHMPVLRLPTRAAPVSTQIRVREGQPHLVLAVPLQLPEGRLQEERIHFDVRAEDGTLLQTLQGTVAELTALGEESGVIPLMLPGHRFQEGRYVVVIAGESDTHDPILRIPFEVLLEE